MLPQRAGIAYIYRGANAGEMEHSMGEAAPEVAPQTGERRIVITDSAARRIAVLKTQEEAEGAFLRIAVSGGGCSGFQYGMSFDDQQTPDDVAFEKSGVTVV